MAWITRLPSDLWMACVYTPLGRRYQTHELKSVVKKWADEQERQVHTGDWIDPREGTVTIGDWWDRTRGSWQRELASRRRDESHWRCHVEPYWGRVPIGAVLKPDVKTWVEDMRKAGAGPTTIEGSLGVLRALFEAAVDARVIRVNPARGVSSPRRNAHLDRLLEADEDQLLLDSLERQFPGRVDAALFVEMLLYCGLRWEEAAALDREHVLMRRQLVDIGPVVERNGNIRPYPKSPAGERPVPVPDHLWPRLRDHVLTVRPGGLLFTARRGGTLHYSTWHDRVWQRGLLEVTKRGKRGVILESRRTLDDPQPTPHDLRHTYGTRLGEQGVPPHEIMALMGHENLESVQRYLHARDDRFDRARKAIAQSRVGGTRS